MSYKIESLQGYPVLDSRGDWTVACEVKSGGKSVVVSVPQGASVGKHEVRALPAEEAVTSFGEIESAISNFNIVEQEDIDNTMVELDGSPNLGRLGANAILAVSLGVAHLAAESEEIPLYEYIAHLFQNESPTVIPTPLMNEINGGLHGNKDLDFQEYMVVPHGAPSFYESLRAGSRIYKVLGEITEASGVGAEGGYAPNFESRNGLAVIREAAQMLTDGIEKAGFKAGKEVSIALDPAASEYYRRGVYFHGKDWSMYREKYVDFVAKLASDFPIISIEDGVAQDDDDGWRLQADLLIDKIQLVGDDRYVTDAARIRKGIKSEEANAVLIKLNQIGTLTKTLDAIRVAQGAGWSAVISHRSGETEDTTIADLAVATSAGQIKAGAPARGERTAKYNRLLVISRMMEQKGITPEFAGFAPFE